MSYEKVSELVSERSGTSDLSDQRIYQIVQTKALEVVREQAKLISFKKEKAAEIKAVEVDIYDAEAKEILWFGVSSGRMEKENDVIVAHRQKRKGMSWSKSGSRNLAIVTAHFNQDTDYLP